MTEYQLQLTARYRPEVLERILRVVRHRGFTVLALNGNNQGETFTLNLTVRSERALDLLKNQLLKLPDVIELSE
ncbi:acetolactate synthase 2 small subunit [Conservatibacter flavescens]|uniref:Acetolactate synthase 2 small subunit n=1 Tax=Conservatibacter flavescens TaxID=28161 RepID=A0A2M8S2Z3_9PAST|nr:acetolactate synthase 2 small subunit [Conservatibacter flavescens]PJG85520.1 acetolactate synthase 2 small subunit [Conservatibacter flavescens]